MPDHIFRRPIFPIVASTVPVALSTWATFSLLDGEMVTNALLLFALLHLSLLKNAVDFGTDRHLLYGAGNPFYYLLMAFIYSTAFLIWIIAIPSVVSAEHRDGVAMVSVVYQLHAVVMCYFAAIYFSRG